jgi:hypothetical protein
LPRGLHELGRPGGVHEDQVVILPGQGLPKSLSVSDAIRPEPLLLEETLEPVLGIGDRRDIDGQERS